MEVHGTDPDTALPPLPGIDDLDDMNVTQPKRTSTALSRCPPSANNHKQSDAPKQTIGASRGSSSSLSPEPVVVEKMPADAFNNAIQKPKKTSFSSDKLSPRGGRKRPSVRMLSDAASRGSQLAVIPSTTAEEDTTMGVEATMGKITLECERPGIIQTASISTPTTARRRTLEASALESSVAQVSQNRRAEFRRRMWQQQEASISGGNPALEHLPVTTAHSASNLEGLDKAALMRLVRSLKVSCEEAQEKAEKAVLRSIEYQRTAEDAKDALKAQKEWHDELLLMVIENCPEILAKVPPR